MGNNHDKFLKTRSQEKFYSAGSYFVLKNTPKPNHRHAAEEKFFTQGLFS